MRTLVRCCLFSQFLCIAFSVNKQLDDKERVAAALENPRLRGVVDKCLAFCDAPERTLPKENTSNEDG